jgi:hypothetical protein
MPGPMTSDGSRYGAANNRFSRALRDGDLNRAIAASRELPRAGLRDAAKLLFLMARNHDRRYPKGCRPMDEPERRRDQGAHTRDAC